MAANTSDAQNAAVAPNATKRYRCATCKHVSNSDWAAMMHVRIHLPLDAPLLEKNWVARYFARKLSASRKPHSMLVSAASTLLFGGDHRPGIRDTSTLGDPNAQPNEDPKERTQLQTQQDSTSSAPTCPPAASPARTAATAAAWPPPSPPTPGPSTATSSPPSPPAASAAPSAPPPSSTAAPATPTSPSPTPAPRTSLPGGSGAATARIG
ncbi:hypothetical protein MBLNU459_g2626t1 [Dothideomycetes sp. NU459]